MPQEANHAALTSHRCLGTDRPRESISQTNVRKQSESPSFAAMHFLGSTTTCSVFKSVSTCQCMARFHLDSENKGFSQFLAGRSDGVRAMIPSYAQFYMSRRPCIMSMMCNNVRQVSLFCVRGTAFLRPLFQPRFVIARSHSRGHRKELILPRWAREHNRVLNCIIQHAIAVGTLPDHDL